MMIVLNLEKMKMITMKKLNKYISKIYKRGGKLVKMILMRMMNQWKRMGLQRRSRKTKRRNKKRMNLMMKLKMMTMILMEMRTILIRMKMKLLCASGWLKIAKRKISCRLIRETQVIK